MEKLKTIFNKLDGKQLFPALACCNVGIGMLLCGLVLYNISYDMYNSIYEMLLIASSTVVGLGIGISLSNITAKDNKNKKDKKDRQV